MIKELISKGELETKVIDLGTTLTDKCHEIGGGVVFVCVMNGGFMFYSDLVKNIKYPIETSFLKCKSYDGLEQKEITLDYIPSTDFKDKTVFIVDDILDTGGTMNVLIKHFKKLGAKQVETVSAVYKENLDFPDHLFIYQQKENVNPWYIGYGMDGPKGYSRNLDTIKIL